MDRVPLFRVSCVDPEVGSVLESGPHEPALLGKVCVYSLPDRVLGSEIIICCSKVDAFIPREKESVSYRGSDEAFLMKVGK